MYCFSIDSLVYSLGYQVFATIGLTIAFCLSGMFYWVNIWFIFVAFALMNGSGRAVGLDRGNSMDSTQTW